MTASTPRTITFAISGPIERADLPGLCARVCSLLEGGAAEVALCDVRGVQVDAVTVDALARLHLAAQRNGCRVELRHASHALRDLVAFMGLRDVLVVEPRRQAEEREDRIGVEEERELDDLPVLDP